MNKKGFGKAKLDKVSENPVAVRGREQLKIEKAGGAKSKGGSSSNAINGIRENHTRKSEFIEAAKKAFGEE